MNKVSTQILHNTVTRKIYIYDLCCKKKNVEKADDFSYPTQLFSNLKSKIHLLEYNNTNNNRWYGIESVQIVDNIIEIVLISCKYKYKPNLINIQNKSERPSPKTDDEGDKEKTHILIKNNQIAYEQKRNGTSTSVFLKLLNIVWKQIKNDFDSSITSLALHQVIDTDFLNIIRNASKIKNVKFCVKSELTNSDYFNFSNDNGVEDTYVMEFKAKKRKEFNKVGLIDKLERIFSEGEKVCKVTVNLYDEDDNPRIINTDEISKQFNIPVEKNENGEVISSDIMLKMRDLI